MQRGVPSMVRSGRDATYSKNKETKAACGQQLRKNQPITVLILLSDNNIIIVNYSLFSNSP